ncbi:hypothetical protein HHI36_010282 [Cryptolaemus montrouzieri]|uniref:Transposase n=1 Tax=Cryptolaemus montrouzieri TaxID=559131 RepID=A0ABD2MJ12_9CUCU
MCIFHCKLLETGSEKAISDQRWLLPARVSPENDELQDFSLRGDMQIGVFQNVLFSDECRFCLVLNDRRMPVYRRPGERYQQCNIRQTENFGGSSVMVWGGISFHGRTELVLVNNGRMTGARYIADILEPHVLPFGPLIGENFIYMHDNTRPHACLVEHSNN